MNPERWQQVEEIFATALERPREERARYVAQACGDDAALEQEVASLLDSADTAGDYFADLAGRAGIPAVDAEEAEHLVGHRVGNYRLVALLGRGGMGAVYLAERDDTQFEKRTALKLLPLGMDSEESRHRFHLERQILALLEHPGIARLLDGGVTEDGTPYYVMEYVEGTPVDEYCDTQRLSIAERLQIFLSVCDAVQHAHQNLVVHRDLKPRNILVTASGQIKLLDFGIARIIDQEQAKDGTTFSHRARPMTLAYASPEQVRGAAITTASDVYSLGVLLYRLLSGHHPYAYSFSSPAEAERTICGEEPTRPSARLLRAEERPGAHDAGSRTTPAAVARARSTTVQRLGRELAGDLDTIVLMALRKEPGRRYASVSHFAEDVRRYQAGLPVSARKDTLRYRTSRFVRRNKVSVTVAAAFAVTIVALAALAVRYAVTTAAQSRTIAQEAETTEQVSALLVDLFKTADPVAGYGDTVRVRTLLDLGAERVDATLGEQPEMRARMLDVLGRAYGNLGLYDQEVTVRQNALAALRQAHGSEHLEVADALEELALAQVRKRTFEAAETLYAEALVLRRRLDDDPLKVASTLQGLAVALRDAVPDSAEALMHEVLETRRRVLGDEHFQTVSALQDLAYVLRGKGELDSAESVYQAVIPQLRTHGDSGARLLPVALNNLAYLHRTKENYKEAERLYREAIPLEREWGAAPSLILLFNNLTSVLDKQGKYGEAEKALLEAKSVAEEHWPQGHWRVGAAYGALGELYLNVGDTVAAEPYQRKRLESYTESLGPDHGWTAVAKAALATCLTSMRRFEEAERLLLEGYATLRAASGVEDPYTQDALTRLVTLYEAWGKPDLAEPYRSLLKPSEDGT